MSSSDELLAILRPEQVQEYFGKEVTEQTEEAEEEEKVEQHVFLEVTSAISRRRLKTSPAAVAKKKAAQGKRKAVQFQSDKQWTVEQAMTYVPDGFRVFKDDFNGCRRINSKGKSWTLSRSWRTHGGDFSCLFQVLTASWAHYLSFNPNETCPWNFDPEPPAPV